MPECHSLGLLLLRQSSELVREPARADTVLKRACDGGIPTACYDLGMAYQAGTDIGRDPIRALTLFRQACTGGEERSCELVKKAERRR